MSWEAGSGGRLEQRCFDGLRVGRLEKYCMGLVPGSFQDVLIGLRGVGNGMGYVCFDNKILLHLALSMSKTFSALPCKLAYSVMNLSSYIDRTLDQVRSGRWD